MKILYFVCGNPTKKQATEAKSLGAYIRNADACHPCDFVEQCDAVAGDVPEQYTSLPRAGEKTKSGDEAKAAKSEGKSGEKDEAAKDEAAKDEASGPNADKP